MTKALACHALLLKTLGYKPLSLFAFRKNLVITKAFGSNKIKWIQSMILFVLSNNIC